MKQRSLATGARASRFAQDSDHSGGSATGKGGGRGCGGGSTGGNGPPGLRLVEPNLFGGPNGLPVVGGSGAGGSTGQGSAGQGGGQVGGSAAAAAAARKRRSSINVYDQPSSLNSRLRQLETDMLRLDEDRSKLYDDTHSALASFELRIGEIHAILKSRQDNIDKSVENMDSLLRARDEFERQAKLLNEKHERMLDKFMHRETVVARELKLLKNKFDLLEKSRQFRSILHKSKDNNNNNSTTNNNLTVTSNNSDGVDDNASELISLAGDSSRRPSFTNDDCDAAAASGNSALGASRKTGTGASLLHKLRLAFGSIASSLIGCGGVTGASVSGKASSRRRSTKVAPMMGELPGETKEGVLPAQSETTEAQPPLKSQE